MDKTDKAGVLILHQKGTVQPVGWVCAIREIRVICSIRDSDSEAQALQKGPAREVKMIALRPPPTLFFGFSLDSRGGAALYCNVAPDPDGRVRIDTEGARHRAMDTRMRYRLIMVPVAKKLQARSVTHGPGGFIVTARIVSFGGCHR